MSDAGVEMADHQALRRKQHPELVARPPNRLAGLTAPLRSEQLQVSDSSTKLLSVEPRGDDGSPTLPRSPPLHSIGPNTIADDPDVLILSTCETAIYEASATPYCMSTEPRRVRDPAKSLDTLRRCPPPLFSALDSLSREIGRIPYTLYESATAARTPSASCEAKAAQCGHPHVVIFETSGIHLDSIPAHRFELALPTAENASGGSPDAEPTSQRAPLPNIRLDQTSATYFDRAGIRLRRVPSPSLQTFSPDDYMQPQSHSYYERLGPSPLPGEGSAPTYPPGAALPQRSYYSSRDCSTEDSYRWAMNEARTNWDRVGFGTVRRSLAQKNLFMIATAGTLGTCLFLASSEALVNGGPVSLLLSFGIMATVVYSIMSALGEMCTRYPLAGSFTHHAARFIDKSAGFCLGVTYWWLLAVTVPTEISAATITVRYWDHSTDPAVYITVFIIGVLGVNLFGVRYFGEVNFWLSLPKLLAGFDLTLLGFNLAIGGEPVPSTPDGWCLAFHCWQRPGAFARLYGFARAEGRFLDFWGIMFCAACAHEGIEAIATAAGETSQPRNTIPTAIRHVLVWIVWPYIASVVMMGWIVPFCTPGLPQEQSGILKSLNVAQSPFAIAIRNAGIHPLDSIVNAIGLLSAFVAASVSLFGASRSLIRFADEILVWSDERGREEQGVVPKYVKILRKCRGGGLPHYAVAATACFMPLAYVLRGKDIGSVYLSLRMATAILALVVWWIILVSYLRFHYACRLQCENRARFKYVAPLQPWLTYWGLFWVTLVLIFNGFDVFVGGRWDANGSIVSYITLPAVALAYFSSKWVSGTKIRDLADVDLASGAGLYDE